MLQDPSYAAKRIALAGSMVPANTWSHRFADEQTSKARLGSRWRS